MLKLTLFTFYLLLSLEKRHAQIANIRHFVQRRELGKVHKIAYIYTVSQKTRHQTLAHNFPKC